MFIKSVFQAQENRPLIWAKPRYWWLGYILPVLILGSCWGQKTWQYHFASPQAIVVLGGDETREEQAATLAAHHPQLSVWVSSGSPESHIYQTFQASWVPASVYISVTKPRIPLPISPPSSIRSSKTTFKVFTW